MNYELEIICRQYDNDGVLQQEWSCGKISEMTEGDGDTAVTSSVTSITEDSTFSAYPSTLAHIGNRPKDRK